MRELERLILEMQRSPSAAAVSSAQPTTRKPPAPLAEVVSSGEVSAGEETSSSGESEDSAEREKMLKKARQRALNLLNSRPAAATKKQKLGALNALAQSGRNVLAVPRQGLGAIGASALAAGAKTTSGLNMVRSGAAASGHVMSSKTAQMLSKARGPGAQPGAKAARKGPPGE